MDKYYSKKHIKGLKDPKEYVVEDLASYINCISELNGDNFYFRGENDNYLNITSSGLRDIRSDSFNDKNTNVDRRKNLKFIELIKLFYNEVSHLISNIDRENFIVFAQHYGIPTNLIDISISPLISLYFACLDTNCETSENIGFVYLINKSSTINISNIVNHDLKNISFNMINYIIDKNHKEEVFILFRNYFLDNPNMFSELLLKLVDDFNCYRNNISLNELDLKNIKSLSTLNLNDTDYNIIDKIDKIIEKLNGEILTPNYVDNTNIDILSYLYVVLIIDFLSDVKEVGEYISYINFLPIFIYTSPNSFERIRNQQGLFIYQSYYQSYEPVYDLNILVTQRIHPDIVLVIKNKEKILKDLDILGINEKFIYNDLDSIAKYIKRKNL